MRRRQFIACAGWGAVATTPWTQRRAVAQPAALPVIALLGSTSAGLEMTRPFVAGLAEAGLEDGRNVSIRYRWADNRLDRLPGLVGELLKLQPAVIVTIGGLAPAAAAKAATATVPIVFEVGRDPVASGLVAGLDRPGGNLTGVYMLTAALNGKRLELLHEMVPRAATFGALINHGNVGARLVESELTTAAAALGMQLRIVRAGNDAEIEAAFATFTAQRVEAVIVTNDAYFNTRREKLVALTTRAALPAIFEWREFAARGGLMSYGTDFTDVMRQLGGHVARVYKGAKPADLPVLQPTRFRLVINEHTARDLGLPIPSAMRVRADEVIR
ncbi:MAG: ABC transporter substrate-binding protein [Caldimonas sp.]